MNDLLKVVVDGPEKDSCLVCEFCKVGEIDPNTMKKQASCIRFPPTPQAIPTNQGLAFVTGFPIVTKDMICYEFERMEEIIE